MKWPSIKLQLTAFLSAFAVYLSFLNKDARFLSTLLLAVVCALSLETFLIYLKTGRWRVSDSAVISGLIIGYVLSSREPWWVFLLAAVFAIGSKRLIRFHKRHLFNPAAFGIFSTAILFRASMQWKGADLWFVLAPIGFYFVSRIRKTAVVAGYLAGFLTLFGSQALIQKIPLWQVLLYQNYFFIFIMLIEPKTTPVNLRGKFFFGLGVAACAFILTAISFPYDAELLSLLILNLIASPRRIAGKI